MTLCMQLLKGLNFMHESGIVHGDITPDSLFFKSEQGAQIRFVDLGCGCFPTSDPTPTGNGTYKRSPKSAYNMSSVGSFWSNTGALSQKGRGSVREIEFEEDDIDTAAALCRAPEAFFTPPIVSEKMDVWSVGCILYQMETGEPLGQVSSRAHCFVSYSISSTVLHLDPYSSRSVWVLQATAICNMIVVQQFEPV